MINKLKNFIIEAIFPAYCVCCDRLGEFVCENCSGNILKIKTRACPFCNRISFQGRTCPTCRRKHQLAGLIAWGYFKDEKLKEIIHVYKYENLSALKTNLADYLARAIKAEGLNFDFLTYVPLSRKRLIRRGYNQSQLLANELTFRLEVPTRSILKKKQETETQVGLSRRKRIKNLEGVFELSTKESLAGKRVAVIDDVFTTGTTLEECTRVLKGAGAKEVWGITVAKE